MGWWRGLTELKSLLQTYAARFGNQWDPYLSGVLRTYRNMSHESTGEKLSFLLFDMHGL